MSTLSTLVCTSLIVSCTLVHLHVESLSLCSHHFLEQSLRLTTQSLNVEGNRGSRHELCSGQADLQFEKKDPHYWIFMTRGDLKDYKIELKANTVWGKNDDQ